MRVLLTVPMGSIDSAVALRCGADAMVFEPYRADEDGSEAAVALVRACAATDNRPLLFVRLPDDWDRVDAALAQFVPEGVEGFVLPNCRSASDVQRLAAKLAVHEAECNVEDGTTSILAEAGATAAALFQLGSYKDASPRLMALCWSPSALAADLDLHWQADEPRPGPVATAENMTVLAARAAEVAAVLAIEADLGGDALHSACATARRKGINAILAADPEQLAIVKAVFELG